MTVQLEYINHLLQFFKNILALCLMLSVTYYAQNYAGIIGWSLMILFIHDTETSTYIEFDTPKAATGEHNNALRMHIGNT